MLRGSVLEIGPGVYPSRYAFDPEVEYLAIDPDMHYLVSVGIAQLTESVRAQRGSLDGFEYRAGKVLGDFLGDLVCAHATVVMTNVLGDPSTYDGGVSGLFVAENGSTRRTDIKNPTQLLLQALGCTQPSGTLVVIEDMVGHDPHEPDHMMPEAFKMLVEGSPDIAEAIAGMTIATGEGYLAEVTDLYPGSDSSRPPIPGYYDTCFAARLEKAPTHNSINSV